MAWTALEILLIAFYKKGLYGQRGLPFDAGGNPVANGGVCLKDFVESFKRRHGDRACILCDGPLGSPEVDHWIAKALYPGLSIAAHNLLPICHECNCLNKGVKSVFDQHEPQPFEHWFHPVFRPAYGCFEARYRDLRVVLEASDRCHEDRICKLDDLINLSARWTSEFKVQYRNYQDRLRGKLRRGFVKATPADLEQKLEEMLAEIGDESLPDANSIIRRLVLQSVQEPTRLETWLEELTA